MRYIGGKSRLLGHIYNEIQIRNASSVIDIFAGSGVVSSFLSRQGYVVFSNDFLYFSYVLNRGALRLAEKPSFDGLNGNDAITILNNLSLEGSGISSDDCFIRANYSPHKGCERMYFQEKNALKIDLVRITIEKWHTDGNITDDEYYYLLSRLIYAVPSVSNVAGVYGAYLKTWDPRSYKDLTLMHSVDFRGNQDNVILNKPFEDALWEFEADLLYADPPYNSRQYLPNYHILETIARYDYPTIHGKTGLRDYGNMEKSDFCIRGKVSEAFRSLIERARVKSIVISYNNEGLLSERDLEFICRDYAASGTFVKTTIPYRRFKSHDGIKTQVKELLFSFDKW